MTRTLDMRLAPIAAAVDSAGLRLTLHEYCTQSPPTKNILFLHGYLDTGRTFTKIIKNLNRNYAAFCLDFRGHGESDPIPQGGSAHLLDHVKDTYWTMRHLSKRKQTVDILVGHSMGGNVALMLAGAMPNIVSKLILLDSLGPPSEDPKQQPQRLGSALRAHAAPSPFTSFSSRKEASEYIFSKNSGMSLKAAQSMAFSNLVQSKSTGKKWIFPFDDRMRGPAPFRFPESVWRAFCKSVDCPVLFLRAEKGYIPGSGEYADRFHYFKQATKITIPNASHHLQLDAPKEIAKHINDFAKIEPTKHP